MWWYLIVVLTLISLIINEFSYFFKYLLAICVIQITRSFLIELFSFAIELFKFFTCYRYQSSVKYVICKLFPLASDLYFLSQQYLWWENRFILILIKSNLFIILCYVLLSIICLRNICLSPGHENTVLFFSKNFTMSTFMFKLMIHRKWILMY